MPSHTELDAVVVGSGPNGLAAALTLAEAGLRVRVIEANDEPGGGCRTAELTLPGFHHDVCSTVQALLPISPFFAAADLDITLRTPEIAFAHPLDGGRAALAYRDLERTADELGGHDGRAWRRLIGPLVEHADELYPNILGDLRHVPRHPLPLARFGVRGLAPVSVLARAAFRHPRARALFAGVGAHSIRRLSAPLTSAYALMLAMTAHSTGWPVVEGGSARVVDALVARLRALGVEFELGHRVTSLDELPRTRITMLDLTPRQLLTIAGDRLPARYSRALSRYRYGPGVFKIDYALSEPVPWANAGCRRAGTVHLGGTLGAIARSEARVEAGKHSNDPYVLVAQAGVADATRAPAGKHTLWAYCHVPAGSLLDRTAVIDAQIERFAPGFRDTVLARATRNASQYELYDNNYVGGDIAGGRAGLWQSVVGPVPQWSRYRTPLRGTYLCSSSTPPGAGVHGMSGRNAAREALKRL